MLQIMQRLNSVTNYCDEGHRRLHAEGLLKWYLATVMKNTTVAFSDSLKFRRVRSLGDLLVNEPYETNASCPLDAIERCDSEVVEKIGACHDTKREKKKQK